MNEVSTQSPFPYVRDMGQTITALLDFIRTHFLKIIQLFLIMVAPLSVVGGVTTNVLTEYLKSKSVEFSATLDYSVFGEMLILFTIIYVIALLVTSMNVTVSTEYCNMVHKQGSDSFTLSTFCKNCLKRYPSNILLALVSAVIIVIGCLFCILPGIYLAIVLAQVYAVSTIEEKTILESVSRCFTIIKGSWWSTFGLYIVIALVIIVLMLGLYVPLALLGFVKNVFTSEIGAYTESPDFAVITLIVSLIMGIINQVFISSIYISHVFRYFSLAEICDGKGMFAQIDRIGSTDADNLPEETY